MSGFRQENECVNWVGTLDCRQTITLICEETMNLHRIITAFSFVFAALATVFVLSNDALAQAEWSGIYQGKLVTFREVGNGDWIEYHDGMEAFRFREEKRTSEWIKLYDSSREIAVALYSNNCSVYHKSFGQYVNLFSGAWKQTGGQGGGGAPPPPDLTLDRGAVMRDISSQGVRGLSVSGLSIGSNDSKMPSGHRYDAFEFYIHAGEHISVAMSRTKIEEGVRYAAVGVPLDPYLIIMDSSGNILNADDNGGGRGLNSRLNYSVTRSGTYYIYAVDKSLSDVHYGPSTYTLGVWISDPNRIPDRVFLRR